MHYIIVFAGARKNDFNFHAFLSDEAFASLEAEVNRVYDLFVATVAQHRGLTPAQVRATEAGLFFGRDAVDAGLADGLATREDALAQLTATLAAGTPALPRLSLLTEDPAMKQTPDTPALTVELAAETPPVPEREAPAVAPPPAPPAPAAASPAPLEAHRDAALDIAQTCTLAGRPELIAGFLEAGLSPTRGRQELLALQAEASPEIASRIAPVTSPYPRPAADPADNPLLQAVKRRLATH